MNIQLHLKTIPSQCYRAVASTLSAISGKVKKIWDYVKFHYSPKPQLKMPGHPIPNPYPRHYKHANWPKFLDANWGFGDDDQALQKVSKLADPKEKVTALHAAALKNDITAIFRFLAHADVDVEDYRGQTPAYWAAYKGHAQALSILKNFGANLKHVDKRGKTLLRAAVKYNQLGVIDYLIPHVNIHQKDGRGLTPIQLAAYRGHVKAYERLLFYGANETELDPNQMTAKEVLEKKCQENYNNLCFLFKLFSSPKPSFTLKPYNITKLASKKLSAGDLKD